MGEVLSLTFYIQGDLCSEKQNNSPYITELGSGGAETQAQVLGLQSIHLPAIQHTA